VSGKERNARNAPERVAILCVGNVLLLDEGAGPRVAAELRENHRLPANVEVLDRGTMGMALLADLRRFDVVLLVDAVDSTGHPPGTVLDYLPEDIAPYEAFHGAHDTRFVDVLAAASLLGYEPEAHCLGVQVQDISPPEYQIGLTPAVEAAVPLLVECVLAFLSQRGITPLS
jgi:hydrogenase maturation protease